LECGYIDQNASAQLTEKCLEIGRMLSGMMDKAEMFCGEPPHGIREAPAEHFINSDGTVN
jgi:hypothetical protein